MSKLLIIKKIKIKTTNSLRIVLPPAFLMENNITRGDELVMFMADSGELVIRKIKKEKKDRVKQNDNNRQD